MLKENQKIWADPGDAREFIAFVNRITSLLVFQYDIDEVCFVRIKNWFDHKWLNYSGKSVVPFDSGGYLDFDASLQSEWREKLTVPPFNPNRVIHQHFVRKRNTGNRKIAKSIHNFRDSNNNLHNRMQSYSENGLFVWYSSNTDVNKRGSLMMYRIQKEVETWYASFEARKEWELLRTKGIGLNEVKSYLE